MRLPRSISHSLLGLSDAAGHLSALLSSSSICCPSVLQHACSSSSSSSRGWVLLPPDLSSSVPQGSYSLRAGAPCVSAQSITTESAPAQDEARLNTSAATIAAGPTGGAIDACWSSTTRSHNSRRPAMLLSRTAAVSPARPAAAVLARHVHSSNDPLQAIAAGSSGLDAATGALNMPADSNSSGSQEGRGTGVQADAAAGMQPGRPLQQQQQPSLQPQQSSEAAADPARELTRSVKRSQTPQELLQHLQQYKQEQPGGGLNAIHVAASYHRIGDMCRADAAVAGTAAAALLLQHLDQLLPSVQQQLGPRELSNIIRACAWAQHTGPVPQLLSDFVQPAILSVANSWDIGNVLWALAMLEQQLPQQQLEQLLGALARNADTCSCQHISTSLWALAKLGQQAPQQQRVEQLVAAIVSKADTATPHDISISLWALGKLGHQVQQQQLGLLMAAFTGADTLEHAMPLHIANVLLGMAYMGQQLPDAQLGLLLAELSAKAYIANPQHISNSLWAVAKLGQQVPQQQVGQLLAALAGKAGTAVPQDLSNSVWAVAKLSQQVPQQHLEQLLAALCGKTGTGPQNISSTVWALGKLGQPVPQHQLQVLLAAFFADGVLGRATTQAIGKVMLGMLYMGLRLPDAQLQLLLAELAAKSQEAMPQDLANSLWAVARLGQCNID